MPLCHFVSDLHGDLRRYHALFAAIRRESPAGVFLGGDLLPMFGGFASPDADSYEDFIEDVLVAGFRSLQVDLGPKAPQVFLILGNDDPRSEEPRVRAAAAEGVWNYVHGRRCDWEGHLVFGYSFVPPSPFTLKDWEEYDVSRYVDPGCVSPESGHRSVPVSKSEIRYATIADDLDRLVGDSDLSRAIMLFHTPPYRTKLDRAALDGKKVEHVPLDVHVGSIAVRRFIERRQPLVTLHGHVHESTRLTGSWRDHLGPTHCLSAAHDGPELALVRFDPEHPEHATRELLAG